MSPQCVLACPGSLPHRHASLLPRCSCCVAACSSGGVRGEAAGAGAPVGEANALRGVWCGHDSVSDGAWPLGDPLGGSLKE